MNTNTTAYSNKAQLYAKYRWDYAPEAIASIFETTGITPQPVIADIGAGTGILTRHFVGHAAQVYAVEPNMEMRAILAQNLGRAPGCAILDGSAEQTGLPGQSVDLITAGQAIHWFDPEPALAEFRRISRPQAVGGKGWLALVSNQSKATPFDAAVQAICTPENGVDESVKQTSFRKTQVAYYFEGEPVRKTFAFTLRGDFEGYFGAMCSVSYMPGAEHPRFETLRREAKALYDQYYPEGWYAVQGETHLIIGRLA